MGAESLELKIIVDNEINRNDSISQICVGRV